MTKRELWEMIGRGELRRNDVISMVYKSVHHEKCVVDLLNISYLQLIVPKSV